ncbi:4-hydroxyphenylacetaldehyde oxime monooxygenase-like [Triticum dicoccoides]|uniref:4-hydroxyphenylacetaldehyde oxime monooxygenase-like n=1 Tax=Triticum dicoccoides TaxID=85692 RepID=UPI00188FF116|nr:4-hydroxyphenylacetaldehyde oxime monooxygenase-like [Triticum dicoccoides]
MAISLSLVLSPPQQWQLLLLLLALVSLGLLTRRKLSNKGLRLPPGPAQVPILGNLHQVSQLPHRSLRDLARRHGPVMQLQLGTVPTVVVSSAEAAQEVMKTHDEDCCTRPMSPGMKRLSYGLNNVGFAPYGAYWHAMRKFLVVELFGVRHAKAAWNARQHQVEKLMSTLSGLVGEPVALKEHVFSLADGIIGMLGFGDMYNNDKFPHHKNLEHVLEEATHAQASFSAEDYFPNIIGRLIDRITGLTARREQIFKHLDAFFEIIIEQHLDPRRVKPQNGGGDLVDRLVDLWKDNRGTTLGITRDHVKGIIFGTFIGGSDAASVTILWAMAELIRKPHLLKKVQKEIRDVVGSNERVRLNDMPKMGYLKMVVKETLRLHPPATMLLPREAMRDIQIGGYDVPAKTRIYVNAWAIGRDPMSWPDDPEEFKPDRFEASEIDFKGANFELIPFGAGRRMCPALSMSVATVEFTLANLLCCFEWALPDGTMVSVEEQGKVIPLLKTPLVLVPTPHGRV